AFAPDGKTIAAGGADRTIRLWDSGGKLLRALGPQPKWVLGLAFSPDGKTLASATEPDPSVVLWDVGTGRRLRTLRGGANPLRCIAFSPDGRTFASAGIADPIHVWDLETGKPLHRLERPRGPSGRTRDVWRVAFSPDGRT